MRVSRSAWGPRAVLNYKVYCLDGAQKIARPPVIFQASDDEAALLEAELARNGARCELWQGLRLVARIAAER